MAKPTMSPTIAALHNVQRCASSYRKAQAWYTQLDQREQPRDDQLAERAYFEMRQRADDLDRALAKLGDKFATRRLAREGKVIGGAA